ncbi:Mediator complex subunit 20 [Operophtera brumata]|uniref:Mediator of RNA polymerase II transcription subunit 20 n=1 Tax=Operophtera brumata TaxID=104452 RepID=A0A0L7L3W9_OPEBR|nr:Mediator complex subunit 20 [Operophtera brumata]
MGVTVLQQYPVPDNKTGTYVVELLTKRILALGATQQGSFLVDCESYLSLPMESGSKNIHVIADGLFDLLMMKLSQHYTSKKQTKIESKGPRFELGDFCVKLGSGLLGPSIPVQPPQHLMSKMNDIYTPIDTIYQYLEHFSAYRKITTGLRTQ